jgi:hypothetical protein
MVGAADMRGRIPIEDWGASSSDQSAWKVVPATAAVDEPPEGETWGASAVVDWPLALSPLGATVAELLPKPPPRYTDIKVLRESGAELTAFDTVSSDGRYTLDIAIRSRRQGLTKDHTDQNPVKLPPQTETVTVWVVVGDETEEGGEGVVSFDRKFGKLRVPVIGDSEGSAQLPFRLTAAAHRIRKRRVRIGIRLYHKLNMIDHLELDLSVATRSRAASSRRAPAIKVHPKRVADNPAVQTLDPKSAARALCISISKTTAEVYRFALVLGSKAQPGEPAQCVTLTLSETELNDYVARFRDVLLDGVFGSLDGVSMPKGRRDELLERLSKVGAFITTRVFNFTQRDDVNSWYRMMREVLLDSDIVQISLSNDAEDFIFPWQVLSVDPGVASERVDPMNLWGFRFIIEVKRCGDAASLTRAPEKEALLVRYARWHFKNEPEHYARLKEIVQNARVQAQLSEPVIAGRGQFISALEQGGGDLLYVYAHGYAAGPSGPLWAKLRDQFQNRVEDLSKALKANTTGLSPDQIEEQLAINEELLNATKNATDTSLTLSKSTIALTQLLTATAEHPPKLKDAPIVFLNTCQSAQVWNGVKGSFLGFFLGRGARAVVGTECTIPIVFAEPFGRAVLKEMLAGRSVGEAVLMARLALLTENNNLLGLSYSVYGASDAHLMSIS